MIYTQKTRKAMKIAFEIHFNQVDKSGVPYIYHPIHLAEQMETEEETIVSLLHDGVEDGKGKLTIEMIEKEFGTRIAKAISLLTHDEAVPYMEYVRKLKEDPIARKVKEKDLLHNSDETRLENVTEKDKKRIEKYHEALKLLRE